MTLFDLPAQSFTLLSALLGLSLTGSLNSYEQDSLGNFLITVGQVLETNATQLQQQQSENTPAASSSELKELKAQVAALQKRLDSLIPPDGSGQ